MSVDKIIFPLQMQRLSNCTPALKSALVKWKFSDVQNDYIE